MLHRVLIQAGHKPPLEPGHETQSGTPGEVQFTSALQEWLVKIFKADDRFEPVPQSGDIEDGVAVAVALFLHADGVADAEARGHHFGYPTADAPSKKLAAAVRGEIVKITGHPPSRADNTTEGLRSYYGFSRVKSEAGKAVVEHGYLSNYVDRHWLFTHVPEVARAEYEAVCRVLGVEPRAVDMSVRTLKLQSPPQTGYDVLMLQLALIDIGAGPLAADNSFGSTTDAAVRRLQTAKGLGVDGSVGPATRAALAASPPDLGTRTLSLCEPRMQGSDVQRIQERLIAVGFGPLTTDGVYGKDSVDAVERFQEARSLPRDGVVGEQTRAALLAATPAPAAQEAAPIIKLGSGIDAPTLSYNVPDATTYHGRNFIDLDVPRSWFKAAARPPEPDAFASLRDEEDPLPTTPSGSGSKPTQIALVVEQPIAGQTLPGWEGEGSLVAVSGTALVSSGVGSVARVEVVLGGKTETAVPGSDNRWSVAHRALQRGLNELEVRAIHSSGSAALTKIEKRTVAIVLDKKPADPPPPDKPPTIAITSPLAGAIRFGAVVDVRAEGTAEDDRAVTGIWYAIDGGELQLAEDMSSGDWSSWRTPEIVLPLGDHVITAEARDERGGRTPAHVVVSVLPLPTKPPKALRIVLSERYQLSSFLGQYGAGRTLKTFSLLPGEEAKLFMKTYARSSEREKDASSILDSWTTKSNDAFEATTASEQSYKETFQESQQYKLRAQAEASWGWGSAKVDGDVTAGTNAAREQFAKNTVNAVKKHATEASSKRDVQISAEHELTREQGEESSTERVIKNINVSRTLNVVARQMLQEYITLLCLTDARIGYVRVDEVEKPGGKLEDVVTYQEATLPQLQSFLSAILFDELGDGGEVVRPRSVLMERIRRQLENVWDYRDEHHTFVESGALKDRDGNFVPNSDYVRVKKRYTSTYIDDTTGTAIRVPGIILGAVKATLRTPAVMFDALLGGGIGLDAYSIGLQETAVEARRLANESAASEIERNRLAARLVESGNEQGAKIFEQVYGVLRPAAPENGDAPSANGRRPLPAAAESPASA